MKSNTTSANTAWGSAWQPQGTRTGRRSPPTPASLAWPLGQAQKATAPSPGASARPSAVACCSPRPLCSSFSGTWPAGWSGSRLPSIRQVWVHILTEPLRGLGQWLYFLNHPWLRCDPLFCTFSSFFPSVVPFPASHPSGTCGPQG